MLHNANLCSARIFRVDHNEASEVRLKLRRELGVRHHDHDLVRGHTSAEFLAACLRETRHDDAQDDICLIQLLTGFWIKESLDALASECRRYVYREAIYGSQGLKTKSRDLIAGVTI